MLNTTAIGLASADFGMDLYMMISQANPESSIFFSPISILLALAMTLLGSSGKTELELKSVLKLDRIPDESIHLLFKNLAHYLQDKNQSNELYIANIMYGEASYDFNKEFINQCKDFYGAGLEKANFSMNANEYVAIINNWVKNQTNDKIKDLLQNGSLDKFTKLVIINAIYFKGKWENKFDKELTVEDKFYITDEQFINASFMHLSQKKLKYRYDENLKCQILKLPYVGDMLDFVVILPDLKSTNFTAAEMKLSGQTLIDITKNLYTHSVDVWLPKFELNLEHNVQKCLQDLGLRELFSGNANLLKISAKNDLLVSKLAHKAYIKIDEEGTEAAAATAVLMSYRSGAIIQEATFKANHPFIFFIQDKTSGTILFFGKMMKP